MRVFKGGFVQILVQFFGTNSSLLQVRTLKRTFDQFDSDKTGAISVETVNTILKMMGMHVSTRALDVSVLI